MMNNEKREHLLENAMAEVRKAKEEIEKLKKLKIKAQADVTAARKSNDINKSMNELDFKLDSRSELSDYGNKSYWDAKYKSLTLQQGDDQRPFLYEWYIGYQDIREILHEEAIKGSNEKDVYKNLSLLVAGCGNSSLCEDLSMDGFTNICGIDYSEIVLDQMRNRANNLKIRNISYEQADARNMSNYLPETFEMVLDKGTLDAISSGGDASTSPGEPSCVPSPDAAAYMTEMWRILKPKGVFFIITTMPPEIFEPIAISPWHSKGKIFTNWQRGHSFHKLKTSAGGEVFLYSIQKWTKSSKENLMNGIMAMLEEAKSIREDMNQCRELDEFETSVTNIEGTGPEIALDSSELPRVSIEVSSENGDFTAGSTINISYRFIPSVVTNVDIPSLWDDDKDFLCLMNHHFSGIQKSTLPILRNDIQYEVFEYTNKPDSIGLNAAVRMLLPSFGGRFEVAYVRKEPINSSGRSFRYYILGLSEALSIVAPVLFGLPDPSPRRPSGEGACLSRRGAKQIVHSEKLFGFLEDNRNISTLHLSISVRRAWKEAATSITRIMLWANCQATGAVNLTVELDILSSETYETVYATYQLPDFEISGASKGKDPLDGFLLKKARAEVTESGVLMCRFPYSTGKIASNPTPAMPPLDDVSATFGILNIECRFCSNPLLDSNTSIDKLRPLPSGVLDHVHLSSTEYSYFEIVVK